VPRYSLSWSPVTSRRIRPLPSVRGMVPGGAVGDVSAQVWPVVATGHVEMRPPLPSVRGMVPGPQPSFVVVRGGMGPCGSPRSRPRPSPQSLGRARRNPLQGLCGTDPAPLGLDEAEPSPGRSDVAGPAPLGLDVAEPTPSRSGGTEPVPSRSGRAESSLGGRGDRSHAPRVG
jgi:hypothetical protein